MKKILFLFFIIFFIQFVFAGSINRSFSSDTINIGQELIVNMSIIIFDSDLAYSIQEEIPLGAKVISYDSGSLDNETLILRLIKQSNPVNRTLSYKINFSSPGIYRFFGQSSFNGESEVNISGDKIIVVGEPIFDKDKDNIPDNLDKCNNIGMISLDKLNKFGCPKPKLEKFDIKPNFTDIDLFDIDDLEIGVSNKAKIVFQYENVNLMRNISGNYSELDLDFYVNISKNRIEINSSALPELNKSAKIIMYNVSFSNPMILRDGLNCSDCKNLVWSASSKTFSFKVPHFTIYSLGEGPVVLPDEDEEADISSNDEDSCFPIWNCSLWSNSLGVCGTRNCNDKNNCGTDFNKPQVIKTCSTYCGNGACDGDETCDICSIDCGVCTIDASRSNSGISCGDNVCADDEDNLSCSEDCADNAFLFWLVVYLVIGLIILGLFFLIKTIRGDKDKKFQVNNLNYNPMNKDKNSHLYRSYDEYSRFS